MTKSIVTTHPTVLPARTNERICIKYDDYKISVARLLSTIKFELRFSSVKFALCNFNGSPLSRLF